MSLLCIASPSFYGRLMSLVTASFIPDAQCMEATIIVCSVQSSDFDLWGSLT
jgi:hypothetical protein